MHFKIINPDTLLIEHSYEANDKVEYGGPYGSYPHVVVPEGVDPDCVIAQQNGQDVELIEDSGLLAAKAIVTKNAAVLAAYNHMNEDVYAEMSLVFGTNKSDSASAFLETWKLMATNPSSFSSEGLKADKEVGAFHPGDALDTDQKVQDYANARITEANAYAVYRMKRIETFRTERAALLA